MTFPVLAVAQFQSLRGELEHNLAGHMAFMRQAAEQGAEYLLFPELSLIGYEPDIARECAMTASDARLAPIRSLAMQLKLVTTVGVALKGVGDKVHVGALTFSAEGEVIAYAKQYLHPGEDAVFSAGSTDCFVPLGERTIGLCVCADFGHPEHVKRLAAGHAWVYAASVLISPDGYEHDATLLQAHARRHGLPVLMANHGGPTGGWASAGRSGLWNEAGEWVGGLEGAGNGLVIATCQPQGWQVQVIRL
ncbi:hydrolase [Pseudomonas floridensis]|uniref:Hydrolase n=1 Tax=Pseudomonas floridensis TaxID=1958950 RepID=A0A1X0NAJ8_9PSED|nr:carbon-nitrogen hydrolase family protein [Pseudomonas floridensis]ORC60850.1 hydrolase [Pseudomonas floridensis]